MSEESKGGGTEPVAPTAGKPQPAAKASRKIGDGWLIGGMVFASIAIIGVIMGWAFTGPGSKSAVKANAPATTKTLNVELGEFYIKPASLSISPGTSLILNVTNKGTMVHDIKINNVQTPMLAPGKSAVLKTGPIEATVTGFCTVPGHEAAGMKMAITVADSGAAAQPVGSDMAGMGTGAPAGSGINPKDAKIDPNAKPAKTFKASDPTLAPAPAGTVHNVTFTATDKLMEVAPGVKQLMWTFNDTVPGPTLHGKVGDTFNVKLINKGTMGHSLDFHASETSMDTDMRTIQPGESLMYSFVAHYAGVWMYHCGTPPVLMHIANGMYGAVVIDPPTLAPVDHEYLMVQSEFYLGPNGDVADYAKALLGQQDAVVFNGYYNQYVYDPIIAKPGERIRMYVLDIGPNEISSFHIVGTQFDTVYKEGAYLIKAGNADEGASQALDLMPAQGGFVEFTVPKVGMYAIVTHKFNDAARGAAGHIIAK